MKPVCLHFIAAVALANLAYTQVDPRGRSVLFIRGADGSGGLGGGSLQRRTEHLSDINNTSTASGNHGFGQLAATLRADGFQVSQWIESQGTLDVPRLKRHRIVVFASNNRVYSAAEVAAFHAYFDQGGSALFMSDANWGSNWNRAPVSDNQFLTRYGAAVYQDSAAGVPTMRRSDQGRFLLPAHPALSGPDGKGGADDVDCYDGEGVSYFEIRGASGFRARQIVSARGFTVRLITSNGNAGPIRAAGARDVALFSVSKGNATIAGHFDRNTFFNANGTGSNITRGNNRQLALNLFRFLASVPGATRVTGPGCGTAPALTVAPPLLGRPQSWRLTGGPANAPALLLLAGGAPAPFRLPGGCTLWPAFNRLLALPAPTTDQSGQFVVALTFPGDHQLSAATLTGQALLIVRGGKLNGAVDLSGGVEVTLGYPR